jgi:hypothetical protein
MYREWKKMEFPKEYCIWIWKQEDQEVDQEIGGKMKWGKMEEWLVEKSGRKSIWKGGMEAAPENSKESSHSAHANGIE